jgi:hypothetical protein
MAAWLKPFLLAFGAALCLHLVGIAGIGSQMQSASSVLEQRSDPLFTRTIEAASAPAAAAAKTAIETPTMRAATQIAAVQEAQPVQPTLTVAQVTASLPTPTLTSAATEVLADVLFTPARPQMSVTESVIATATPNPPLSPEPQVITTQPTGSTDSLLATGEWPGDTRVSYVVTGEFRGSLHGKGQVQWTRSGLAADRYQVRVDVDVDLAVLRWTSQGRVTAQGLQPEAFEESVKQGFREARVRPLKLEATELVLSDGRRIPRPREQPMAVQDSVSQFIDLGHRIAQGRDKLEVGQVISIWLGRPGGLDQWVYDVGEPETLHLPRIGPVTVFPLKPRPVVKARGTIMMSMWLAPSLQNLPAKIRIDLNPQTHVELTAERFEQR